jgi:hypothetical protein
MLFYRCISKNVLNSVEGNGHASSDTSLRYHDKQLSLKEVKS